MLNETGPIACRQTGLQLQTEAEAFLVALPGVRTTQKASYRVANKVFVRMEFDESVPIYCFKLSLDGGGTSDSGSTDKATQSS